jgi:hypothetical protein
MRLQRRPQRRPSHPLFYVGRVLMHADRTATDHLQVAVIRTRYAASSDQGWRGTSAFGTRRERTVFIGHQLLHDG